MPSFSELKGLYLKLGGDYREFKKLSGEVDVGFRFSFSKKISEADIQLFGLVSGDMNPIHFDEEFAKRTKFGGRVAHGMLTTSLVSTALAMLPGTVVLLETSFKYTSPVRIGDLVTAECEVVEREKNRLKVNAVCKVGDKVVAEGWARILLW
ncbi:MAG: MaoC family dehydratase [Archaeoglobales archaeon]|jgi:3-hydroxybutyryl-CoA dehydratase|nr:MaoC family dehydratase [Archaeoglobi archaeon]NHW23357.1 MaoC family dehydratase [Archaeoglobales archaeon]TDA28462.1 MAG: acyl dehydratase [Archaeoglobi archaeon]